MTHSTKKFKNSFYKTIAAVFLIASNLFGQGAPQTLAPNRKIERKLRGGEKSAYQVKAAKDDFVRARVEQKAIDVSVKIYAPNGTGAPFAERDTPNGRFGAEDVSFIAPASGVYTIEVTATDENALQGSYEIKLEKPHEPREKDVLRARAEQAYAEALKLRGKTEPDAVKQARAHFTEAAADFRAVGEKRLEIYALAGLAFFYSAPEETEKALETVVRALDLARVVDDKRLEASITVSVGEIYTRHQKSEIALGYFERAAAMARRNGDEDEEIYALQNAADYFYKNEKWQSVIDAYDRILTLHAARGDKNNQAGVLNFIGILTGKLNDRKSAVLFYEQSAAIYRELKNGEREALALENAAVDSKEIGDSEKALNYFRRSYALRAGDAEKSAALEEIVDILRQKNDYKSLDSEYENLLKLYRALDNRQKIGDTLNYIGINYGNQNERGKAADFYNQSIDVYRVLGKRKDEAQVLYNLGVSRALSQESEKAFAAYDAAAAIYKAENDWAQLAQVLEKKVSLYKFVGEYEKAVAVFGEIPLRERQRPEKRASQLPHRHRTRAEKRRQRKFTDDFT